MRWVVSWRADPVVRALADRHYSRQTVGHPQFVAPGRCLVLRTLEGDAAWVTSWPLSELARHGYGDAWVCTLFRNESEHLSSELISEAVAATLAWWLEAPVGGFLTFVDERKIRRKRDPGRCFRRAGFVPVGRTKERDLLVLQLLPDAMPEAEWPSELQLTLTRDWRGPQGRCCRAGQTAAKYSKKYSGLADSNWCKSVRGRCWGARPA